jgi:hypothetical protein
MRRAVAPPGYWDKAVRRAEHAYQGGELLYQWRLEDLRLPRKLQFFSVGVRKKPRLVVKVYFLEGHWIAAISIRPAVPGELHPRGQRLQE